MIRKLRYLVLFQVSSVQKARVPPAPVRGWAPAHVTGVVGGSVGPRNKVVATTGGPVVHHRFLLVLGHPLEAGEHKRECGIS